MERSRNPNIHYNIHKTHHRSSQIKRTVLERIRNFCHLCSQHGGGPSQRLSPEDRPLALQNAFLERLGYTTTVRRARLGIDPELRHLLRFHTGPATPQPGLEGFSRCGAVLVLKGLVFPQWRRRSIAVLHSRLLLYPGKSSVLLHCVRQAVSLSCR